MAATDAATSSELIPVVALLGAAVVMVPIVRRLGMSSILGYLVAGLIIGPFGLGWIHEPEQILHFAELGVVMFLFIVGLEMRPSHLWALRKQIFGLGSLQIGSAIAALTGLMLLLGYDWKIAFVAGAGFTMTSTPIVMQLLSERGDIALPRGQQMVSVAIFEDILIVPLLATVALLAPVSADAGSGSRWTGIAIGAASIAGLVLAGLFLLNPMFRILARSKAREVMTAAALLVVLGAALLMQLGGLSMAMGAFLAGVLLSESSFRHQIEADIEPFRGILLGLFFIAVGMSLNVDVVRESWPIILMGVPVVMAIKGTVIYLVARIMRSSHADALDRAVLMAQSGEFAFVLYSAAVAGGLLDAKLNAELSAIVILSMVMTPLVVLAAKPFMPKPEGPSLDGVEEANGLSGSVLLVGFGRFGQVTSQALLARDVDVTIIDSDVEMIQDARNFGFKIYYGDGTRLDVMEASGAKNARAIIVAVDDRDDADKIVAMAKDQFPQAKLLVRSFDRGHSLSLVNAGVDFQIRETFESALKFGEAALRELGVDAEEAAEITANVRQRDAERFELEIASNDTRAGRDLLIGNIAKPHPRPTPFTKPRRAAKALNQEAEVVADQPTDDSLHSG